MTKFSKIDRISVVFQVYQHIREAINRGELPPGTHLPEVSISSQMGVSRAPVREALLQLEAEGLVELRPGHGAFVRTLSARDVEEIYSTRILLEGCLVTEATELATQEDIQRLREVTERALEVARGKDIIATINADLDIHKTIWQIANHQIIKEFLYNLETRIRFFLAIQAPLFEDLTDSVIDHVEIVRAMEQKDSANAKLWTEEHIRKAGLLILNSMKKNQSVE
jgi:DNA-binding GntR family transcriptional regulator